MKLFSNDGLVKVKNMHEALSAFAANNVKDKYTGEQISKSSEMAVELGLKMLEGMRLENKLTYFQNGEAVTAFYQQAALPGSMVPEIYNQHTLDTSKVILAHLKTFDLETDISFLGRLALHAASKITGMETSQRFEAACNQLEARIVRYEMVARQMVFEGPIRIINQGLQEIEQTMQQENVTLDQVLGPYHHLEEEYSRVASELPAVALTSEGLVNRPDKMPTNPKTSTAAVAGNVLLSLIQQDIIMHDKFGDKAPHKFIDIAEKIMQPKKDPSPVTDTLRTICADFQNEIRIYEQSKKSKMDTPLMQEKLLLLNKTCEQLFAKVKQDLEGRSANPLLCSVRVYDVLAKASEQHDNLLRKHGELTEGGSGRILNKFLLESAKTLKEVSVDMDTFVKGRLVEAQQKLNPDTEKQASRGPKTF